jgi:membrane peptidoglycan carboxypeptidase
MSTILRKTKVRSLIAMRQRRRSPAGSSQARRANVKRIIGLGCSALLSISIALAGILLAFAYTNLTRGLPSVELLPALLEPPGGLLRQPTRLYDRSGEHILLSLENQAAAESQYLRYAPASSSAEQPLLSSSLITATLATAEPNFWRRPGFSLSGIPQNAHLTLAQRLVDELLLQDEPPSLRRALRERLLAAQLTARFGHEKVLEWYLNNANYGRLAYGADAAARLYLGKSASQLDLAEAALLAAVSQAPALNPLDNPQAALERQKYVIQDMLRYRVISPEAGIQAAQAMLQLRHPDQPGLAESQPNLAFANLALEQLEGALNRDRLERGGLKIITTLDYDLQQQTDCASQVQLARLRSAQAEAPCEAARLLPTLSIQEPLTTTNLQTNAVILDPLTGHILALVNEPAAAPEAAYLQDRSAGSLTTPIVYLTAFTRGFSPATLVWDIPEAGAQASLPNFAQTYHGPVRLRIALANDYLAPAQSVMTQVGVENVWRTAQQLDLIPPGATLQPGASVLSLLPEISLLKISQAFGVFANQGILAGRPVESRSAASSVSRAVLSRPGNGYQPSPLSPVAVLRVEDYSGRIILNWRDSQTRPIITTQLAYLMTNVLSDEVARWPSLGHPNALEIGSPAAAKIGQSPSGESNWAVGYTPQRVVGVWLGSTRGASLQQEGLDLPASAARSLPPAAAGLWHALIQYASRDLPYQSWVTPPGISTLQVCDPSGMLPTPACPNVVDEVFLAGSEPTQADDLYRALQVNRETDRLATIFTSPNLVDKRTYLFVPPEAQAWASNARLAVPPADYDIVPLDLPAWPDATITSPAMFVAVRGLVSVRGTTGGEDFASYRLQVGQGLNPQAWYLVGQDVDKPISKGQLGAWDTSGLQGLYAIQLLVVHKDQSIHRTTTLVTVDNQPPGIQITFPVSGAEISTADGARIVLQASVLDDIGLHSVAFYIDDRLLTTFVQPPFAVSWTIQPGAHTLRVEATDLAGNTSETSVSFSVK